jgi:cell division protein FtsB
MKDKKYPSRSPVKISTILSFTGFLLSLYFAFHLVHGDRGYFALKGLEKKLSERQARFAQMENKTAALQQKVRAMRPTSLDLDMLEEQVRENLGYAKQNEIVVINSSAR